MEIFFHIGVYIPLLPALITAWYWKKLNKSQQWFGVMLWIIAVISLCGRIWTVLGYSNNLPFFHSYILVEALFLLFIFREILGSFINLLLWKSAAIGFSIFWLYNVTYGETLFTYPAHSHAIEALIMMSLAIGWFAKVLREKEVRNIHQTFDFWFCTGVFIFFSSNFLFFLFSSFIVKQSHEVFKAIWGIHAILAILLYLIYSYAIRWAVKTQK